jgi:hypothetical protein
MIKEEELHCSVTLPLWANKSKRAARDEPSCENKRGQASRYTDFDRSHKGDSHPLALDFSLLDLFFGPQHDPKTLIGKRYP